MFSTKRYKLKSVYILTLYTNHGTKTLNYIIIEADILKTSKINNNLEPNHLCDNTTIAF